MHQIYFRDFCRAVTPGTDRYYFCLERYVYNSPELFDKILDIKIATHSETFDLSALYNNLPLDVIYGSLRQKK